MGGVHDAPLAAHKDTRRARDISPNLAVILAIPQLKRQIVVHDLAQRRLARKRGQHAPRRNVQARAGERLPGKSRDQGRAHPIDQVRQVIGEIEMRTRRQESIPCTKVGVPSRGALKNCIYNSCNVNYIRTREKKKQQ